MSGVKWLERIMDTVADRGRELLGLREDESRESLPELCRRLIRGRGEASNIALAREILQRFEALDGDHKTQFFVTLSEDFGPDAESLRAAAAAFRNDSFIRVQFNFDELHFLAVKSVVNFVVLHLDSC